MSDERDRVNAGKRRENGAEGPQRTRTHRRSCRRCPRRPRTRVGRCLGRAHRGLRSHPPLRTLPPLTSRRGTGAGSPSRNRSRCPSRWLPRDAPGGPPLGEVRRRRGRGRGGGRRRVRRGFRGLVGSGAARRDRGVVSRSRRPDTTRTRARPRCGPHSDPVWANRCRCVPGPPTARSFRRRPVGTSTGPRPSSAPANSRSTRSPGWRRCSPTRRSVWSPRWTTAALTAAIVGVQQQSDRRPPEGKVVFEGATVVPVAPLPDRTCRWSPRRTRSSPSGPTDPTVDLPVDNRRRRGHAGRVDRAAGMSRHPPCRRTSR